MRKQIFGAAALLCLSVTPAHSYTLEKIAENCQRWSEVNFSDNLRGDKELLDMASCFGYFTAFKTGGALNCMIKKEFPDLQFFAFGAHNNYSVEQLVQFTLNFKRDNPDKWGYSPALLADTMLPNAKCD